MSECFSLAFGVGTQNSAGQWLEVFYPQPHLHPAAGLLKVIADQLGYAGGNQALELRRSQCEALSSAIEAAGFAEAAGVVAQLASSTRPLVCTVLATDEAPTSTPEAYLKLHLLSHRLVKPHGVVLAGIFPLLPNVAWTNHGAIDITELPQRQLAARLKGETLNVHSIDKFPSMTDYVVPAGSDEACCVYCCWDGAQCPTAAARIQPGDLCTVPVDEPVDNRRISSSGCHPVTVAAP